MAPTELPIIRRHDRPFFIVLRKISLGDDGDYVLSCMCIPVYLELSSNINSETGLHVFAQSRESPQVPATADENRKRMKRKIRKETTNNGHSRLCKVNTSPPSTRVSSMSNAFSMRAELCVCPVLNERIMLGH
jgi:hypothetical protein